MLEKELSPHLVCAATSEKFTTEGSNSFHYSIVFPIFSSAQLQFSIFPFSQLKLYNTIPRTTSLLHPFIQTLEIF